MLKLIEEPPAKTIFIFATTDPQKIPRTILSRVQRYDFQRITTKGIEERIADKIKTIIDSNSTTNTDQNENNKIQTSLIKKYYNLPFERPNPKEKKPYLCNFFSKNTCFFPHFIG